MVFRPKIYICNSCKEQCYPNKSPEIVFMDETQDVHICENCSIDFEEDASGHILLRDDLMAKDGDVYNVENFYRGFD